MLNYSVAELRYINHIGVGSVVARSTGKGNLRASVCGTGDGHDPRFFFFYSLTT